MKVITLTAMLIGANIAVWAWALITFHAYPALLGTAFLAYVFGLRHAVDADHIAAIDNITRKLMQQGKRPTTVGLFFSLGHSTVVIGLSLAIALTSISLKNQFTGIQQVGGIIGTSISALFLLAIATANLIIFLLIYRTFQKVKSGGVYVQEDIDLILSQRGFFGRIFRNLFHLIEKSWHMYLLGLLFGLGFDTATEVGILGISAAEATKGMQIWSIMVFPALFTAGMALIDTADNLLMLGAYGWAFLKPIRKLYYNMTLTAISVLVALFVGGVEVLGVLGDQFKFQGFFWETVGRLNDNFEMLGFAIIALFVLTWLTSAGIYKLNRYDDIEVPTS